MARPPSYGGKVPEALADPAQRARAGRHEAEEGAGVLRVRRARAVLRQVREGHVVVGRLRELQERRAGDGRLERVGEAVGGAEVAVAGLILAAELVPQGVLELDFVRDQADVEQDVAVGAA